MLYRVLAEHLETFLARVDDDATLTPLPGFVRRELRAFLRCGQLSQGFCRLRCEACGTDELVAFACKRRGFCPACCSRRMADLAAHLTDHVLPDVPVRQWVLSYPFALRSLLAYDADLCREVRGIFIRAVMGWIRRRARRAGFPNGRTGAVVSTQRFDSALRLAPHHHGIALDGVVTELGIDKHPRFHVIPPPTDDDVAQLVATIRNRVCTLLRRRGRLTEDDELLVAGNDDERTALSICQANAVQGRIVFGPDAGRPVRRLRRCPDPTAARPRGPLCAEIDGFSLQAAVAVASGDTPRLERLARYITRPPLVHERLSLTDTGRVRYKFRRAWRDGTTAVEFDPLTFIARLAALIPAPRTHLLTYHGILAPAASYRDEVVPGHAVDDASCQHRTKATSESPPSKPTRPKSTWAELLARVYGLDVLRCPCGGRRHLLTFLTDPAVVEKILAHLGLPLDPPAISQARAPPSRQLAFS